MARDKKQKNRDYFKGFIVVLVIIIIGTSLELISKGRGTSLPSWPMNLYIGISFTFIIVFLHFFYGDTKTVKWLSRVPASISSIVLFTLLNLILGLIKQNNPEAPRFMVLSGLDHIRHTYTFLFSGLYLLTSLGLVILRRLNKFNFRNTGFFLNHFGLWLIIFAGSLGAGDLNRLNIHCYENKTAWYGVDRFNNPRKLPFTIKLLDFDIAYYNPKIALINNKSLTIVPDIENNLKLIEVNDNYDLLDWNINILEFLPGAERDSNDNYISSIDTLAFPVAKISISGKNSESDTLAYITCGNMINKPVFFQLNETYSLAMTNPEAQEYSSFLEITDSEGNIQKTTLIVNKPVKVEGWNLYQLSYDDRYGKWSRSSIIEAIKDPWLPLVYIGIFMAIAGALYLFISGKKEKED